MKPLLSFRDTVRADLRGVRDELKALSFVGRAFFTVLVVYIVAVSIVRFHGSWGEWVSEGDWRQWIYQYWRYTEPGTFPPGHWLTDYSFNMQPPFYWLMMATLSTFMVPMKAAVLVNIASWTLLIGSVVAGVRGRAGLLIGLIAAALLVREIDIFQYTSGGYPRSFGPSLTALFLAAFINDRFRLALFSLILGAGLYPSVVVPCSLALGVWTTLSIVGGVDRKVWFRRMVALAVTAVVVAGLGMAQTLTAKDWWGSVVWAQDAGIELGRRGRCNWLPLPPYWQSLLDPLGEIYHRTGWFTSPASPIQLPLMGRSIAEVIGGAAAAISAIIIVVKAPRRFPLRLVFMFAAVLLAYFIARELAFKLYLPKRVPQHTLPVVVTFALTVLIATAVDVLGVARRFQTLIVAVVMALPIFILVGDGVQSAGVWGDKTRYQHSMLWIRENTKPTDVFAGDLRAMDWIPLFGQRATYVNFTLAHPFRAGFWHEVERRTLRAYDAYYATDLREVLRFMDEEHVEYFVIDTAQYRALSVGFGALFEPMASEVKAKIFDPRKKTGFALANAPKEIQAYKRRGTQIIERELLRTYLAKQPAPAPTPPPTPPPTPAPAP